MNGCVPVKLDGPVKESSLTKSLTKSLTLRIMLE